MKGFFKKWNKKKKNKLFLASLLSMFLFSLITIITLSSYNFFSNLTKVHLSLKEQRETPELQIALSQLLTNGINLVDSNWPSELMLSDKKLAVEYTIDQDLENHIKKILKQYKTDYASVVVLNTNNGDILAAIDYNGKDETYSKKITFYSTSPAASIFKVITAADIIEHNKEINSEATFSYSGRPTTLYKYQIENLNPKNDKPLRFRDAFAKSNNVVFARAALKYSAPSQLFQTAENFGFNKNIFELINLGSSYFPLANGTYNLAELASGLNTMTLISPLHAAKIAMTIANDGVMKSLKLVRSLKLINPNSNQNDINNSEKTTNAFLIDQHNAHAYQNSSTYLYYPFQSFTEKQVIHESTAKELKLMMQSTINKGGTGQYIGKKLKKSLLEKLEIGGKSGQMTGGIPLGKRDWFIAYAKPFTPDKSIDNIDTDHNSQTTITTNDKSDKGISIAVMLINQEKWYTRSVAITKEVIDYYFNK